MFKRWITLCLAALMLMLATASQAADPVRVMIITGANNHDWKSTTPELKKHFDANPRFTVVEVLEMGTDNFNLSKEQLAKVDVIVSNWTSYSDQLPKVGMEDYRWPEATWQAFKEFIEGGGGFVTFHANCCMFNDVPEYRQLTGLTWQTGVTAHGAYHTFMVEVQDREHPITKGIDHFFTKDELYHKMQNIGDIKFHQLAQAVSDGAQQGGASSFEPMLLTSGLGKGRSVYTPLGHDARAVANKGFGTIITRAAEWAATGNVTIPLPTDFPIDSSFAEIQGVNLDSVLPAALAWNYGEDRSNLFYVEQFAQYATASGKGGPERAAKFAATLSGTGTVPGKEWVLKQLSIIGTPAQVPQIAALLKDEKLNYMARRALEKIPGDQATQALRGLLASGTAEQKIGAVTSLAMRNDQGSVDTLIALLDNADDKLANEAGRGLAQMGNAKGVEAVITAWGKQQASASPLRLQGLSGAVLAVAEAKLKAGDKAGAEKIYTQVHTDKQETLVGAAGLRGIIMIHPEKAGEMLLTALQSPSRFTRDQASRLVRELPAGADLKALHAGLPQLDESAQLQLILALGDRGDAAAIPALRTAAESGTPEVKIASLRAIGLTGSVPEVAFLAPYFTMQIPAGAQGEGFTIPESTVRLHEAAAWALSRLRGKGVDEAITAQVQTAPDIAVKAAYVAGLGARDAKGVTDSLIAMTQQGDPAVKTAAWKALETLAESGDLPKLFDALSKAETAHQEDARRTIGNLIVSSSGDQDYVPAVMERLRAASTPEAKVAFVRLLGAIGNKPALEQLQSLSADADPTVARAAVQTMSSWTDVSAVETMLVVARGTENPAYRALTLQGVARLVPKMVQTMPLDKLFSALNEALALAPRPEEKRALLDPISKIVRPELLQPLVDQMADPAVVEEASLAVVTLAEGLMKESPAHASPALQSAMQKVIGSSKTPATVDRANAVLLQVSTGLNQAAPAAGASAPAAEALASLDAAPEYAWDEQADSIALLNHGKIIWKFNYQADAAKPYFHPVALPNGDILTEPLPADHPWHRALWFSWKEINGVNYWEENDGQAKGKTVTKKVDLHKQPDFSAHLIMDLAYHEEGQPDVLTERRHIHISPPLADHSYWMNWQSSFTAQSDVELKGGTAGGGYAGLSVRISAKSGEWKIVNSEGLSDVPDATAGAPDTAANTHGKAAAWADFTLKKLDSGQEAGITIMEHPANDSFPSQWHNVMNPHIPFGYYSPAPLWSAPRNLKPGQILDLRYHIVIHPGRTDVAATNKAFEKFAGVDAKSAMAPLETGRNFSWIKGDGKFGLKNGEKIVWQLNYGADQPKPSMHPVATADGTILTEQGPQDHPWHRALWFSWLAMKPTPEAGVDEYWAQNMITGETNSVTEVLGSETTGNADYSATIKQSLSYHPKNKPAQLTEERTIKVSAPDEKGGYMIDWQGIFTAPEKVILGPGYGGLSVRLTHGSHNWSLLNAEGLSDVPVPGMTGPNTNAKGSKWATYRITNNKSGRPESITIFDHPANTRYPSPWHNVLTSTWPFGFFSPTPHFNAELPLEAGQVMPLKYRVLVRADQPEAAELETLWQEFSKE